MTDETKNDGGPAFPAHPEHYDNDSTGMTLRDYFATNGDMSKIEFNDMPSLFEFLGEDMPLNIDTKSALEAAARCNAKLRYMFADAMLVERSK
jgi:hypothetical protein